MPGILRSRAASSLPAGAWPSPNSAMRPSAKATQPRSITRSARTILALAMRVSCLVEVITSLPSCRSRERRHIDDPVGDQMTDFVVTDDRHHRHALALVLGDQLNHHTPTSG